MIVSKCPVRISIAGGSTDLDSFILKHGRGSVISFSANIYTYASVFRDKFGQNVLENQYNVVYSKKERVKNSKKIKNELVRAVLEKFSCEPLSCWLTADVSSAGSGLASSSSYVLSLVHAINKLENLNLNKREIIETSWKLEKTFNPLTGFQDPFGCAYGGLNIHQKKIDEDVISKKLDASVFNEVSMFLLPTFINRSSTKVLKKVKDNVDHKILDLVDDMLYALENKDVNSFLSLISDGWLIKKNSSPAILGNKKLQDLDTFIESCEDILAHRLIGAGNGGYFLLITKKDLNISRLTSYFSRTLLPISIDYEGLRECKN